MAVHSHAVRLGLSHVSLGPEDAQRVVLTRSRSATAATTAATPEQAQQTFEQEAQTQATIFAHSPMQQVQQQQQRWGARAGLGQQLPTSAASANGVSEQLAGRKEQPSTLPFDRQELQAMITHELLQYQLHQQQQQQHAQTLQTLHALLRLHLYEQQQQQRQQQQQQLNEQHEQQQQAAEEEQHVAEEQQHAIEEGGHAATVPTDDAVDGNAWQVVDGNDVWRAELALLLDMGFGHIDVGHLVAILHKHEGSMSHVLNDLLS